MLPNQNAIKNFNFFVKKVNRVQKIALPLRSVFLGGKVHRKGNKRG
jgi:hypothetical protein